MPNYLTYSAACTARRQDAPYTIRIEYVGYNPKTKGGHSSKFWQVNGSSDGSVKISWGKIGGTPRSQWIGWNEATKRLHKKRSKGYSYVRGSLETWEPPTPKAPRLTGPFALIKALRSLGRKGWEALDSGGSVLFELPTASGTELRDVYSIPVAS